MAEPYDAVMIVSFGGPEGMGDVRPFLENVLRGRDVPAARMLEVVHHYEGFGGVSPINQQCRDLKQALEAELSQAGIPLPVYWGNRNWDPYIEDTLRQMKADGVKRFLAFVTSTFSSYSGCRQYREDLERAREAVGAGAPAFGKIRMFYNHPDFVELHRRAIAGALQEIGADRRARAAIAFTAHSIPQAMADHCDYVQQLTESCRLIADALGRPPWKLVYQSRSGPPHQPWLEPDIGDHLEALHADGITDVIVSPVGFLSDHMEVLFDLDTEAREKAAALGMTLVRAATPGTHPVFVTLVRKLIQERLSDAVPKECVGARGPSHDVCPVDCCLSGRPKAPAAGRI